MMKFVEEEKSGVVLGNRVKAKPVPFVRLAAVGRAEKAGDTETVANSMVEIVSACVTMEDGSPVDANELSQSALVALFNFATGIEATGSDFTSAQ